MNIRGHVATGTLVGGILFFPLILKVTDNIYSFSKNIFSFFYHIEENLFNNFQFFNKDLLLNISKQSFLFNNMNYISIIFFFYLFYVLGNILPDLDTYIAKFFKIDKKFNNDNSAYQIYHRQLTHSILLHLILIFSFFLFSKYLLINQSKFALYSIFIFFLLLGSLTHVFIDIFFGKGGVPLFFYTDKWFYKNSKFKRLSIPLFKNGGIIENLIIIAAIGIIILFTYFFNTNKIEGILINVILFVNIFFFLVLRNTKDAIKKFIYLMIFIILFFKIFI